MLWGVLYCFGIKAGVGSDCLCEFFHLVRLQHHLGVSADSLRKQKVKVKAQIIAYAEHQQQSITPSAPIEVCVGTDEVFLGVPFLVALELSSGFILTETAADNRQYETWKAQADAALPREMFHCRQMVSDQAKALIKLALKGVGCQWIPDLFHLLLKLGQPFGSTIGRQLGHLSKQLTKVQTQLERARQQGKNIQELDAQLGQLRHQYEQMEQAQQTYHQAVHQMTTQVHPFCLEGSAFQTAHSVQAALHQPLQTLQTLAQTLGLAKATTALETFKQQIPAMVMGVNGWWSWVLQALEREAVSPEVSNWLLGAMLPWVYWDQQAHKTKNPQLKHIYQQAAQQAAQGFMNHPLTAALTQQHKEQWWAWSMWMVAKFQRTSSAVEGRNGYLSRLHHNCRGLDPQTLKVLTIIHNYDLKRVDGTTAAQRLFGQPFP